MQEFSVSFLSQLSLVAFQYFNYFLPIFIIINDQKNEGSPYFIYVQICLSKSLKNIW